MSKSLIDLFEAHLAIVNFAKARLNLVCNAAEPLYDNFKDETTMEYQNLKKK